MRPTSVLRMTTSFGLGLGIACLAIAGLFASAQRRLLYFPSHDTPQSLLQPWRVDGAVIGYAREVPHPKNVWLMTHGNAGQAASRDYVLPCLSPSDSLYVLEYPGYGARPGKPSRDSFDQAAVSAYRLLRAAHPGVPVCAIGESIGSGPACFLASQLLPPDKIVLVVPFDTLASVASEHFPWLPVRLILLDRWDNLRALQGYRGKVDIFGASDDRIIPIVHARRLAASHPSAVFTLIPGGHNDWAAGGHVVIRND